MRKLFAMSSIEPTKISLRGIFGKSSLHIILFSSIDSGFFFRKQKKYFKMTYIQLMGRFKNNKNTVNNKNFAGLTVHDIMVIAEAGRKLRCEFYRLHIH